MDSIDTAVATLFLTVLKTWTSPFDHSVIIHFCVRLEFSEVSARAPCLRISELDCLVSGFTPNTCVLPWRGRECLVRHLYTPPAVARGHRLVFAAIGNVYCRSALNLVKMTFLAGRLLCTCFCRYFKTAVLLLAPLHTRVWRDLSLGSLSCKLYKTKGSIRESLLSWL